MIDSKLKVLIVDDDPRFLEVMKSSLESKNCLVQCATEEKKALSLLSNDIFHAVFIDCVLASGEGTKLIQDIKSAIGSSVEIIMMSGIVSEKSLSSYIDLGVCDFLSKPISDKEIEKNLNKIREKYIYGHKQNILTKLFKSNNSEIQNLKFLISLKKAKDYEFFLYLNSALSSKESLIIEFKFNNMSHKIMCDKQTIINYECDSSKIFLNRLLSKNLISAQEIGQLKGHSQEECINILLEKCILSSGQILDIKYDMLIETLKEICPGIDISLNVNLVSSHNFSFLLFNKDEYADLIFLFLKQKFNNQLFSLFDENTMNKSLIFKDRSLNYLPEIEGFIEDLKSGMKLKGIYNKYMNDKNSFCSYLFYVLLKGNVYLSEDTTNLKYYRFYERYQSLYKFINKIKKPEHLFLHLSGLPKTSEIETIKIKEAYLHFIKCNHPDSIPFDLPKDLSDLINKILGKVKLCYDLCCDPALKIQERQKMKQKNVEKEILLTEKKKICERYLEEEEYKKAFEVLESVPQTTIDEETHWQLLYLWLYFSKAKIYTDTQIAHRYMKCIQTKTRDLQKNKLYHYISGLYNENKQNYALAKTFFEQAKGLDPSFQPCYPKIKKCSLTLLEQKKESQPALFKLKSFSLNSLRKKSRKVS